MIALFDLDSLIYQCLHKIVGIGEIRFMLLTDSKEEAKKYIVNEALEKINNRALQILGCIYDEGIEIESIEYYVTNCSNNFRKKIDPNYKANRKGNKWVKLCREKLISLGYVKYHDTLEADDLIANRVKDLKDYIIISIDKDLQTIKGLHYNYYPVYVNGEFSHFKGLNYVMEFEANKKIAELMLIGDSSDNIKGLPKIGKVRASNLLRECKSNKDLFMSVYKAYYRHFMENRDFEYYTELVKNYKLIKLGNYEGIII